MSENNDDDNKPYIVCIKDKCFDYTKKDKSNNKKNDKQLTLRQNYFKVVKKDKKTGKMMQAKMDQDDVRDYIKGLVSQEKFKNYSFEVAVFYENIGWVSCKGRESFNGDENPIMYHTQYDDPNTDFGDILDFIIYSLPKNDIKTSSSGKKMSFKDE